MTYTLWSFIAFWCDLWSVWQAEEEGSFPGAVQEGAQVQGRPKWAGQLEDCGPRACGRVYSLHQTWLYISRSGHCWGKLISYYDQFADTVDPVIWVSLIWLKYWSVCIHFNDAYCCVETTVTCALYAFHWSESFINLNGCWSLTFEGPLYS